MKRLSKSGIEWLRNLDGSQGYTWNFYSGCQNWSNGVCPIGTNCWAMKITQRFKQHYPNGFEPTFYPEAFLSPLYVRKPSKIGVAFMGDLFGDWVDPNMPVSVTYPNGQKIINCPLCLVIKDIIQHCLQHTFIFLTKCPWNLPKWNHWPTNAWVGVTATDNTTLLNADFYLGRVDARVKFISLEPFLEWEKLGLQYFKETNINWLIIGAQTNPYRPPKKEWVAEIIDAADRAGIPVFLKDNLRWPEQRREWPKVR